MQKYANVCIFLASLFYYRARQLYVEAGKHGLKTLSEEPFRNNQNHTYATQDAGTI